MPSVLLCSHPCHSPSPDDPHHRFHLMLLRDVGPWMVGLMMAIGGVLGHPRGNLTLVLGFLGPR